MCACVWSGVGGVCSQLVCQSVSPYSVVSSSTWLYGPPVTQNMHSRSVTDNT